MTNSDMDEIINTVLAAQIAKAAAIAAEDDDEEAIQGAIEVSQTLELYYHLIPGARPGS